MKFNNILVVLNPDNEKQYALARAVRLVLRKNVAKCMKQPLNNNVKPYNFI